MKRRSPERFKRLSSGTYHFDNRNKNKLQWMSSNIPCFAAVGGIFMLFVFYLESVRLPSLSTSKYIISTVLKGSGHYSTTDNSKKGIRGKQPEHQVFQKPLQLEEAQGNDVRLQPKHFRGGIQGEMTTVKDPHHQIQLGANKNNANLQPAPVLESLNTDAVSSNIKHNGEQKKPNVQAITQQDIKYESERGKLSGTDGEEEQQLGDPNQNDDKLRDDRKEKVQESPNQAVIDPEGGEKVQEDPNPDFVESAGGDVEDAHEAHDQDGIQSADDDGGKAHEVPDPDPIELENGRVEDAREGPDQGDIQSLDGDGGEEHEDPNPDAIELENAGVEDEREDPDQGDIQSVDGDGGEEHEDPNPDAIELENAGVEDEREDPDQGGIQSADGDGDGDGEEAHEDPNKNESKPEDGEGEEAHEDSNQAVNEPEGGQVEKALENLNQNVVEPEGGEGEEAHEDPNRDVNKPEGGEVEKAHKVPNQDENNLGSDDVKELQEGPDEVDKKPENGNSKEAEEDRNRDLSNQNKDGDGGEAQQDSKQDDNEPEKVHIEKAQDDPKQNDSKPKDTPVEERQGDVNQVHKDPENKEFNTEHAGENPNQQKNISANKDPANESWGQLADAPEKPETEKELQSLKNANGNQFGKESNWRSEVEELYKLYNPSMLPKLESLLERYAGREKELVFKIKEKYAHQTGTTSEEKKQDVPSEATGDTERDNNKVGAAENVADHVKDLTQAAQNSTADVNQYFLCDESSKRLPVSWIDDDFCDCKDGSDETHTSACSFQTSSKQVFVCSVATTAKAPSLKKQKVFASRVDDGICDCCDGSDEHQERVQCPNRCHTIEKDEEAETRQYLAGKRVRELKYMSFQHSGRAPAEASKVGGGTNNAFFALAGHCFYFTLDEYEYSYCPYRSVVQKHLASSQTVSLGKSFSWQELDRSMIVTNGTPCLDVGMRSTVIEFICGISDNIIAVSEYEICVYSLKFQTPAACI